MQSIFSHNAEPFKKCLVKVGYEHLDELTDLQLAIEIVIGITVKKRYSEEWITQRLKTINNFLSKN